MCLYTFPSSLEADAIVYICVCMYVCITPVCLMSSPSARCQFPTLGFVVSRFKDVNAFTPETHYSLALVPPPIAAGGGSGTGSGDRFSGDGIQVPHVPHVPHVPSEAPVIFLIFDYKSIPLPTAPWAV
jgi:hypothetical protein